MGYLIGNATKVFPLPGGEACRTMPAGEQGPGVAVYDLPSPSQPVTLIGLPTITATITTADGEVPGELAAELWDVDEGTGRQQLVDQRHLPARAQPELPITFQLNGSAWTFEPGHHAASRS
jgi:hypothetical protein